MVSPQTRDGPCTLAALHNAVKFPLVAATLEQTEAGVRDGWALSDIIEKRNELEFPHPSGLAEYWYNRENPGHTTVDLRNVRWAGGWAGASRIILDFRRYENPRATTPEFQQRLREKMQQILNRGETLNAMRLQEELPEDTIGYWDTALMVRTADGTWVTADGASTWRQRPSRVPPESHWHAPRTPPLRGPTSSITTNFCLPTPFTTGNRPPPHSNNGRVDHPHDRRAVMAISVLAASAYGPS